MVEIRLGYEDKDKTIKATKVGDTIAITLPENATTGFQWRVSSFAQDALSLESIDEASAPFGALGAGGGDITFRFKSKAAGRDKKVILKLSRGTQREDLSFEFVLTFDIYPNSSRSNS